MEGQIGTAEDVNAIESKRLAKVGFDAYNESAGGKTHDGKDIPSFEQLVAEGKPQVTHWMVAAEAIKQDLISQCKAKGKYEGELDEVK